MTNSEVSTRQGHILVVDDNDLNRDLLQSQLRRLHYTVSTARDGEEALAMLRAAPFDLVLLDIMMPGLDGFGVLETMRGDPYLRDIPVIVISALTDMDDVVRGIRLGAEDYLVKPFNAVLLRARVESGLVRKQMRDAERKAAAQLAREKQQIDALLHVVIPTGAALAAETDFGRLLLTLLQGGKDLAHAEGASLLLRTAEDRLDYVIAVNDALGFAFDASDEKPSLFAGFDLADPAMRDAAPVRAVRTGRTVRYADSEPIDQDATYDARALAMIAPESLLQFDAHTGYQTRSMLTIPLVSTLHGAPHPTVIGALQYVNPRDPLTGEIVPFTDALQQLLEALSALAAAVLAGYMRKGTKLGAGRARIHIDDAARRSKVEAIAESDYFRSLHDRVLQLRRSAARG
jgi:DNA-binding response OmpR family regulator